MKKEINYLSILFIICFMLFGIWLYLLVGPYVAMADINETSILNTTVNISNSGPEVRTVTIANQIYLTAYDTQNVECNVTVYDYDNNIAGVNATFFYYQNSPTDPDHNATHYTNTSCTATSPWDYAMNFSCTFDVEYFANNGTWYCNATAWDDDNAAGNNQSDAGVINPLVAIYVPGLIDYGELAKGDISATALPANITNAGNRDINISVEGWGVNRADGWAMNCTYGHIDVQYERYNSTNEAWANMYQLTSTGSTVMIPNFWIDKRDSNTEESWNATYWRLEIPAGAGGICNGKILFEASDFSG